MLNIVKTDSCMYEKKDLKLTHIQMLIISVLPRFYLHKTSKMFILESPKLTILELP